MRVAFLVAVATLSSVTAPAEATPSPSDGNKAIVRQHIQKVNAGDIAGAIEDWAQGEVRDHGAVVPGRGFIRAGLERLVARFPDWYVEVLQLVAEGDTVAALCRVSGTHPASGGRVDGVYQIQVYRLREGKLVDHYTVRDELAVLRQLGVKER